jgi:Polyketide cyclase / dehydrase and lipid transport
MICGKMICAETIHRGGFEMWSTEHSVETTASPEDVWRTWADVPRWPEWNADLTRAELAGPFTVGSRITMTPQDGEPIELMVADAVEPGVFVDEARLGETLVRTIHRVEPAAGDRRRITYRMEISGSDGETLGPMISGDFPDVLAALVGYVER